MHDLRELDVLDTEPEAEFDDVVQLASKICGVPISLISLVDAERQWFKASVGMDEPQTPVEQAICAHAILEDDYLEIGDTRLDPRTADNALVRGPEDLRFYAGAVLRSDRGHALGTLCVLDNKPNRLTDLQREALRVLARQVVAQLELRRALREAEVLRREVDHRVKNSLQSVSALTRMQARSATSEETREALDLTGRRIETVALLHQHLYCASADGAVDLADVVPRVARLLQQSMPAGIRIETEVTRVSLSAAHAAAVGVILNEFATNSAKHAFEAGGQGLIRFVIDRDGEDHVILTCSDNGRGMSSTSPRRGGLGLRIIEASAQQLGGPARIESDERGTVTTIRIALSDEN
ncbi:sensor histidine kinase [Pseudooceanicola batsensis HTCC2597]|uniref:Sensor histidine kinase n=1 Tax=Pseudooceanicola batsensis (strain ATCC BAA-863 / DSM 15984 / KCTC 12145 / HTCC2597) TaxID=252305 RepID=A3TVX3_PSEBH|nr:sensor histidine kinase [Pseudooceanicola batsensis HTCC2597]